VARKNRDPTVSRSRYPTWPVWVTCKYCVWQIW